MHTEEPNVDELYQRIDTMTATELDALPQGAIQLDRKGKILQYNETEARLANLTKESVIGRNFFTDVAPCTDVQEFHGRFLDGIRRKELHETFRYHFSFKVDPVDVSVTLFYSGRTDTVWVFIRRLED